MTGKDVLPDKELLEKAATMKRFEYSYIGKKLKPQTDITKEQCQGLDIAFISNKGNKNVNESLIKKEKPKVKKFFFRKFFLVGMLLHFAPTSKND